MYGLLRQFGARFSNIDAICQQTIATARLAVPPKGMSTLFAKLRNRFTSDSAQALKFMSNMDENQIIDVTTAALGGMLDVHRKFKERHQPHDATPSEAHPNMNTNVRQPNDADVTAAQQTTAADAVADASTTTYVVNQALELRSRTWPAAHAHVKILSAADFNDSVSTISSRVFDRADTVELEEIVVLPSDPLQTQADGASDHRHTFDESYRRRVFVQFDGAKRASQADFRTNMDNQDFIPHILDSAINKSSPRCVADDELSDDKMQNCRDDQSEDRETPQETFLAEYMYV